MIEYVSVMDRVPLPREGRGDGGVNPLHIDGICFSYQLHNPTTTTNDSWSSANLLCVFNSAVCTFCTTKYT